MCTEYNSVAYGVQCAVCTEYNSVSYGVHVYRLQHVAYGVQCGVCRVYKVCTGVQCTGYNVQWYHVASMWRMWRVLWRIPRAAGGWGLAGWRLGAGGWRLAGGWRSRLCSSGWRSRPCARAAGGPDRVLERLAAGGWGLAAGWRLAVPTVCSSGWRLGAGGWLGVPLERLAVPTLWRGIVFGGVGLAIGGFWKVFSYPPYKRDFPKPPFAPSRSNKLTSIFQRLESPYRLQYRSRREYRGSSKTYYTFAYFCDCNMYGDREG